MKRRKKKISKVIFIHFHIKSFFTISLTSNVLPPIKYSSVVLAVYNNNKAIVCSTTVASKQLSGKKSYYESIFLSSVWSLQMNILSPTTFWQRKFLLLFPSWLLFVIIMEWNQEIFYMWCCSPRIKVDGNCIKNLLRSPLDKVRQVQ